MIPIDQTLHTDKQNGNCLAASLASLLELPISDIPKFENMGKEWFTELKRWLLSIGFAIFLYHKEMFFDGYYLVFGTSPRNKKRNHAVIFKGGKLIHDPHPSRDGVSEIKETIILIPLDPSKIQLDRS